MSNYYQQFSNRRRASKVPEKSSFVHTCNLLSQFIKEKGCLRDLNLEIGGKLESLESIMRPGSSHVAASTETNLLTKMGKSVQASTEKKPPRDPSTWKATPGSPIIIEDDSDEATIIKEEIVEHNSSQLTLFYAGRVLVFDDYPAEKAKELVHLAGKVSSNMSAGIFSTSGKEKLNADGAQEWKLTPQPEANSSREAAVILSDTLREKTNAGVQEWLPPQPDANDSRKASGILSNSVREKMNPGSAMASGSGVQEWLPPQPEVNGSCKAGGIFSNLIREKTNPSGAVASSSAAPEWLPPQPEAEGSRKGSGIFSNTTVEKMNPVGTVASSSGTQEWFPSQPEANGSQKASGVFVNPIREKVNPGGAVSSVSGAQGWFQPHPETNGSSKTSDILSNPFKQKMNPGGAVASSSGAKEWLPPQPEANKSHISSGFLSNHVKETTKPGLAVASSSNTQTLIPSQPEATGSDLPIARRSSLHRFLEKRKDRAAARGPYQQIQEQPASSSKSEEQLELKL